MLHSQDSGDHDTQRALLRQRVSDAQARLDRHLAAIETGIDPQALVTTVNSAQADKAAAQAELANLPAIRKLTETEIRKLIDSLGDIRAVLTAGAPSQKISLYQACTWTYVIGPGITLRWSGPTLCLALVSGGAIDHYAHALHQRQLLVIE